MLQRLKGMTRNDIESSFKISGKKGKEGTTFRAGEYAVKLFKNKKSSTKLAKEADLQSTAADYGVAPVVHFVSTTEKFIIMDALEETIVDKGRREKWTSLPAEYRAQLYALCKRLDTAGVVQNDGNPLNLMLDGNGRLFIIDYGFAMKIDRKVHKEYGPQPNVSLTLWSFSRRLGQYRFVNDLRKNIVDEYMEDNSFVDQALLAEGERLLGPIGYEPAPVVRKEKPPARKEKPVVRKEKPPARKEKPVVRKEKPVVRKEKPVVRKEKPVVRKEKPVVRKKKPVVRKKKPVVRKKKVISESESSSDDSDDSDDSDWVLGSESSESSESSEEDVDGARRSSVQRNSSKGHHYHQYVQKKTTLEERIKARAKVFGKYKLNKEN